MISTKFSNIRRAGNALIMTVVIIGVIISVLAMSLRLSLRSTQSNSEELSYAKLQLVADGLVNQLLSNVRAVAGQNLLPYLIIQSLASGDEGDSPCSDTSLSPAIDAPPTVYDNNYSVGVGAAARFYRFSERCLRECSEPATQANCPAVPGGVTITLSSHPLWFSSTNNPDGINRSFRLFTPDVTATSANLQSTTPTFRGLVRAWTVTDSVEYSVVLEVRPQRLRDLFFVNRFDTKMGAFSIGGPAVWGGPVSMRQGPVRFDVTSGNLTFEDAVRLPSPFNAATDVVAGPFGLLFEKGTSHSAVPNNGPGSQAATTQFYTNSIQNLQTSPSTVQGETIIANAGVAFNPSVDLIKLVPPAAGSPDHRCELKVVKYPDPGDPWVPVNARQEISITEFNTLNNPQAISFPTTVGIAPSRVSCTLTVTAPTIRVHGDIMYKSRSDEMTAGTHNETTYNPSTFEMLGLMASETLQIAPEDSFDGIFDREPLTGAPSYPSPAPAPGSALDSVYIDAALFAANAPLIKSGPQYDSVSLENHYGVKAAPGGQIFGAGTAVDSLPGKHGELIKTVDLPGPCPQCVPEKPFNVQYVGTGRLGALKFYGSLVVFDTFQIARVNLMDGSGNTLDTIGFSQIAARYDDRLRISGPPGMPVQEGSLFDVVLKEKQTVRK